MGKYRLWWLYLRKEVVSEVITYARQNIGDEQITLKEKELRSILVTKAQVIMHSTKDLQMLLFL